MMRLGEPVPDSFIRKLMKYPNVTGVSRNLVPKLIAGEEHSEIPCIRVYVRQKLDPEYLKPKEMIPATIGKYRTDVVEAFFTTMQTRMDKIRPVMPGISVSQRSVGAGTIGICGDIRVGRFVYKYLLTCAHVLHPYAPMVHLPRDPRVVQPGMLDLNYDYGKLKAHLIGRVIGWSKIVTAFEVGRLTEILKVLDRLVRRLTGRPFPYDWGRDVNYCDVAIATIDVDYRMKTYACFSPEEYDLCGILFGGKADGTMFIASKPKYWRWYMRGKPIARWFKLPWRVVPVDLNDKVIKDGRSTGVTEGTVFDNRAMIWVYYPPTVALFDDVFIVRGRGLVAPGDSGSIVLKKKV